MKIGIITLPLHINYGGILQAYALQTILQRMGHETKVLDYDSMKPKCLPLWKSPIAYSKRIIKNLLGRRTPIFLEQKINREKPIIRQYTNKFIEKHLDRLIIEDFKQIHENDFDAFIVGSDQVWRPIYFEAMFNSGISNAYLEFTDNWNVIRLSYAASFGTDDWEYTSKQTESCSKLLKKFNGVSVREDTAVSLCKKHFGVHAEHVLDPTMLLTKEDYIKLIEDSTVTFDGQIMTYILDCNEAKTNYINSIASKTGYKTFSVIATSENILSDIKDRIQPPLENWLKGFADAKLVITDSFHACVFSILFRKPFLAILNEDRGAARFRSLLELFGLEDRIVEITKPINTESIEASISDSVYDTLTLLKNKSLNYLNKVNHSYPVKK